MLGAVARTNNTSVSALLLYPRHLPPGQGNARDDNKASAENCSSPEHMPRSRLCITISLSSFAAAICCVVFCASEGVREEGGGRRAPLFSKFNFALLAGSRGLRYYDARATRGRTAQGGGGIRLGDGAK
jgi:hypothetical protein